MTLDLELSRLEGYSYSFDTDQWTEGLIWYGYNTFRYASGCAAADGYIYSFGGYAYDFEPVCVIINFQIELISSITISHVYRLHMV